MSSFSKTSSKVTITIQSISQSEFTGKNTEPSMQEFIDILPPDIYKLISFDVTSLFRKRTIRQYHRYHFEANLRSEGIRTLVYTGTKLGFNFDIKYITKKEHKRDLPYGVKCPKETCNDTYNGEVGRKLVEQIDEHRRKDKNSHVYQHSVNTNHTLETLDDLNILNSWIQT